MRVAKACLAEWRRNWGAGPFGGHTPTSWGVPEGTGQPSFRIDENPIPCRVDHSAEAAADPPRQGRGLISFSAKRHNISAAAEGSVASEVADVAQPRGERGGMSATLARLACRAEVFGWLKDIGAAVQASASGSSSRGMWSSALPPPTTWCGCGTRRPRQPWPRKSGDDSH